MEYWNSGILGMKREKYHFKTNIESTVFYDTRQAAIFCFAMQNNML
jgi:hypothetical protein